MNPNQFKKSIYVSAGASTSLRMDAVFNKWRIAVNGYLKCLLHRRSDMVNFTARRNSRHTYRANLLDAMNDGR